MDNLSWTKTTTLSSMKAEHDYITVRIGTGHTARCKTSLLSVSELADMTIAVKNNTPVRLGAFAPWSPYKWFVKIENVGFRTNKVIVQSPIMKDAIKHAVTWAMKDLKLSNYEGDKALIVSLDTYNKEGVDYQGYAKHFDEFDITAAFISVDTNQKSSDIFKSIFHEMVHFKQYVAKELVGNRWKGELIDTENTPYRQLPWEVEAWSMHDVMTDAWVRESY